MGKFDGILIVSDFDGTWYAGDVHPPKNAEMVRYFTQEGGKFALSSGRCKIHMEWILEGVPINAPCSLSNGANIYDFHAKEHLYTRLLPGYMRDVFAKVLTKYPDVWVELIGAQGDHLYAPNAVEPLPHTVGSPDYTFFEHINDVQSEWQKALIYDPDAEKLRDMEKTFETLLGDDVITIFTSPNLLEVCPSDATKGTSLLKIAEMLGIDRANTYGIGDYWNDVDLIRAAGTGCAVGNALPEIQEMAEWVLCDATEGAVGALVEKIERERL